MPDVSGTWELGVRAVGPARVELDGETVVELTESLRGGAFFGMGSPEVRGTVELEEGRRYELTVDYPVSDEALVRGLVVGARAVPVDDAIARAVAVAEGADLAIVIVGTDDEWETEGEDRTSLALPGAQDELVAAVAAANANTVVVLNTGSPVTMPWLDAVPAVLQLWFPGQEIGDGLVDVLTGDAEPGGRLPTTFPKRLEDTPAFAHHPGTDGRTVYAEGLFIGHRWYDREEIEPLFPFGFGLGYTTFSLDMAAVAGGIEHGVTVDVDVTNTGERAGSEVVQIYVEPPSGDPARPLRHLAGFGRIELGPRRAGDGQRDARPAGVRLVDRRRVGRPTRRVHDPRRPVLRRPGPRGRCHRSEESQPPVDGVEAGGDEGGVGLGEGFGAEEAVVRRQR